MQLESVSYTNLHIPNGTSYNEGAVNQAQLLVFTVPANLGTDESQPPIAVIDNAIDNSG